MQAILKKVDLEVCKGKSSLEQDVSKYRNWLYVFSDIIYIRTMR